jgi:DNA polymerase
MSDSELKYLLSALRGYLVDVRETGVDGLPITNEAREIGGVAEYFGAKSAVGEPSVAGDADSVPESLEEIRQELAGCQRCSLGASRTTLVFGAGNEKARIVFVGEAPGREEDLAGEPFVGEAGRLLTKIIQAMGFERDQVYICNVLKCRPPDNRNPLPTEIDVCRPFLLRQMRAIGPEVIVALGTFSAQTLLHTHEPISKLRGRFHDYHGIPLMPTFHPAFLLRNPSMKREVWDDMQAVMKRLGIKKPRTD